MNITQILGNPKDRWDTLIARGFSFETFPTSRNYVGITMRTPEDDYAGVVISLPTALGNEQIRDVMIETCESYADFYELYNIDGLIN